MTVSSASILVEGSGTTTTLASEASTPAGPEPWTLLLIATTVTLNRFLRSSSSSGLSTQSVGTGSCTSAYPSPSSTWSMRNGERSLCDQRSADSSSGETTPSAPILVRILACVTFAALETTRLTLSDLRSAVVRAFASKL